MCVYVGVCMCTHTHTGTKKESVINYNNISENHRTGHPQGLVGPRLFLHSEETVQALPGADKFTWPGERNPAREIRAIKAPSPSELYQRAPSQPSFSISVGKKKKNPNCSPLRNGTVTRVSQFT